MTAVRREYSPRGFAIGAAEKWTNRPSADRSVFVSPAPPHSRSGSVESIETQTTVLPSGEGRTSRVQTIHGEGYRYVDESL